MKPLFRNLFLLALIQQVHGQSISINFGATDPNAASSTIVSSAIPAGALPIAGTYWNNMTGLAQAVPQSVIDSSGFTTSAGVTWQSNNTWRSGSPGGTATSQNGILTKGYLDDSANNHSITVANVPFLKYNVYVIGATDQTGFTSPAVNGTNYTYTGGATVVGTANWGSQPFSTADNLVEGTHYLKVTNQVAPTLFVKGGVNAGNGVNRGSLAGIQIENTYEGTLGYWDIDGTTPGAGGATPAGNWTDANWSASATGDAATGAWSAGNGAVFSAGSDATGAFAVSITGDQSADLIWVRNGQVTLNGGGVDLSGTGLLRADGTSSLTVNSVIGGGSVSTSGSVTFNSANDYVGNTSIQVGGLTINGGAAIPDASGVGLNTGANLFVGASETIASLQGFGNVSLDVNTLTLANTAAAIYSGTFSGTGTVRIAGTTGVQRLAGNSPSFGGAITVASGATLEMGNVAGALGNNTGVTTVEDGGTILIGSAGTSYNQPGASETFVISGAGVGGLGALSSAVNFGMIRSISLSAPASIGGTSRWDIGGGGADQQALINGNGHILTKTGVNNIWMRGTANGAGITNLAGLVINQGVYGVEFGDNALGSTPVTVNPGGVFSAWNSAPANVQGNPITLNGGTLDVDAANINFTGAVTLTANSFVSSDGGNMIVSGNIGETGGAYGLTKNAGNTLTLSGANSYTGSTTVSAGVLAVSGGSALPDASPLLLTGGGLLLNASETVGSISGGAAGTVNLGANTLTVNQAVDGVLLGALSGTGGSLVKEGSGALVLNAANTHTGATIVNAGTLRFGGANVTSDFSYGTGSTMEVGPVAGSSLSLIPVKSLSLASGSSSNFRVGTSWDTVSVTDVGGLSTGGTHTINIVAAAGIAPGTFDLINYQGTIGGSGYTFTLGAMPHIVASLNHNEAEGRVELIIDSIENLLWRGNVSTNWDTNDTQNWILESNSNAVPFFVSDNVIFDDNGGDGAVFVDGSVSPGSVTIDNNSLAYTFEGGAITGSGSVMKFGAGTATLANDNTYVGATEVIEGTLRIGDGISGSISTISQLEVSGGLAQVNLAPGATFASPALVGPGGTLEVTGTGDMTWSSALTNATTGALVFNRDGRVYTNSPNLSAGSISINDGVYAVDGNQSNNRFANNKLVTINSGGRLEVLGVNAIPGGPINSMDFAVNGGSLAFVTGGSPAISAGGNSHAHVRNVTLNGGTIDFPYSGNGTAYNSESVQLNGTLTVTGTVPSQITSGAGATAGNSGLALFTNSAFVVENVTGNADADLTISAEIENPDVVAGVLIKRGEGTLLLNGVNSHTGGNTVEGGVLATPTIDSLGSGYLALAGGTFRYTGSGSETRTAPLWIDQGTGTVDVAEAAAVLTLTPTTGAISFPISKIGAGALNLNAVISGTATVTVEAGTLALNGANTHTGDTIVNGGVLAVNGASINDEASLSVNDTGVVNVTGNETVDTLFIDGIQQLAGVYEAVGNPGSNTELAQLTGSGTITVDSGPGETYADWIDSFFPGEDDPEIIGATADPDNDGIPNIVEMVVGNDPTDGVVENLPTIELVTDPDSLPAGEYLKFSFRRSDASIEAGVTSVAEHDTDLEGAWTPAVDGVDGVVIVETPNGAIPGNDVDVFIPRGSNEELFGRLRAGLPVD